jgi:hypothetical protein
MYGSEEVIIDFHQYACPESLFSGKSGNKRL